MLQITLPRPDRTLAFEWQFRHIPAKAFTYFEKIESVNTEFQSAPPDDVREFYQRVQMTLWRWHELLRQHGIETVDLTGQPDDLAHSNPSRHVR